MVRAHLGHFEQGRDQAVRPSAVTDAFANRINPGIEGLQRVAHYDPTTAKQSRPFRQRGVGPDADGHNDEIGRKRFLDAFGVDEADRAHATALRLGRGDQLPGLRAHSEGDAPILERFLQEIARGTIELTLHQPIGKVYHGDFHPALLQAIGGFEAEQSAADHHRMLMARSRADHRVCVVNVAIGDDARQRVARHRQHDRVRSGCQQQAVVSDRDAVGGLDGSPDTVDLGDLLA